MSVLMNLLKKSSFLACVLLATQLICSQESILVLAVEAAGTGGSLSYSIGQVFYTIHTGTSGAVLQGVQNPFEFQTFSNSELTTVNLTAVTYPNPTSDYVVLKISDSALDNLSYKLFDFTGKGISNGNITRGYIN